ncbi:MAG: energy-coupling factor transporter ATPase [bacterium]
MALEFKGVEFSYSKKNDEKALKNINIRINEKDEFVTILGHTGSGKTTLLHHINGLVLPSSGEVHVFDKVITSKKRNNPKMKDVRKKIGFVFQFPEYQLFEETVLKDIMFGPINFGFSKEEAEQSALKYAKLLQIEHLLDKSPFELSGGQMRKVAIAGILAYEPEILLLDEPTRGLDPKGSKDIMEFFSRVNKEFQKTIIMITHDMDIAYKYAKRMIVLKDGEMTFDGSKHELFSNNTYKEYHLSKPLIVELIDEINNELKLGIEHSITDLDELFCVLRGEDNGL